MQNEWIGRLTERRAIIICYGKAEHGAEHEPSEQNDGLGEAANGVDWCNPPIDRLREVRVCWPAKDSVSLGR